MRITMPCELSHEALPDEGFPVCRITLQSDSVGRPRIANRLYISAIFKRKICRCNRPCLSAANRTTSLPSPERKSDELTSGTEGYIIVNFACNQVAGDGF
jgi:hypothetical protein